MREILIYERTGNFAGNKDIARDIRLNEILPYIEKEDIIVLNFNRVESATQSFIHALISDVIRTYGATVLEKLLFKDCDSKIQKVISIVSEYMQEPS